MSRFLSIENEESLIINPFVRMNESIEFESRLERERGVKIQNAVNAFYREFCHLCEVVETEQR